MKALLAALALLALAPGAALGHALEPGYLELGALGGDAWRVTWRKPQVAGLPMPIEAVLPATCETRSAPHLRFDGLAFIAQWETACPGGLANGSITIAGLEATETDVLVRYELAPGDGDVRRLTPAASAFVVPAEPGPLDTLRSYFTLGVEHILAGVDHLLFVLALVLLIRDRWRLVTAITSFTVAHSVTLAAATVGWIVAPGPPVEAVIALSIMFLAAEIHRSRAGRVRLIERYPWSVTFVFGLLHGLGFARALSDIGLPEGDVPLALLAFNLGVEAGQILFVAAVLVLTQGLRRAVPRGVTRSLAPGGAGQLAASYAIGGVAGLWLVERVAGF